MDDLIKNDLKMWTLNVLMPDGTIQVQSYAFGPTWVGSMQFVDDYGFPTKEEAVLDWYHNLFHGDQSDEAVLDWYHKNYKEDEDDSDDETPKDNPPIVESDCDADIEGEFS